MPRKFKKPHALAHAIICDWCGERKEVSRPDAKTCSNKCRGKLYRFTQVTGFPPAYPPGQVSCQHALDLLIVKMFSREKARRAREEAENRQAAEKLFKQQK